MVYEKIPSLVRKVVTLSSGNRFSIKVGEVGLIRPFRTAGKIKTINQNLSR